MLNLYYEQSKVRFSYVTKEGYFLKSSDGSQPSSDTIISLVQTFLGADFNTYLSQIGDVIANGFLLGCINSTFTPSQVASVVQAVHKPYFDRLISKLANSSSSNVEQNLNYLVKATKVNQVMCWDLRTKHDWERCSRLGLDVFNAFFYATVDLVNIILANYRASSSFVFSLASTNTAPQRWVFDGYNHPMSKDSSSSSFVWYENEYPDVSYDIYSVKPIPSSVNDVLINTGVTGGNISDPLPTGNGEPSSYGNPAGSPPKDDFDYVPVVGWVSLGSGFLALSYFLYKELVKNQ